ncbi:multidrug efflux outer membrane protein OprN [Tsuneonella deserti]|uniref:Multidrug efflux outer membrane protein OprN n=1 Tax=Tsuneonella deserti TaxID=2035528 RepID=A0ABQ1S5K8_9SPHN|nr:efflux transporter outer membrane subunit [Tsuneonella deserti]GGD91199.1 multidrug efflux outer membrane protein OprN [Tsuneonella deserti]
MRRFFILLLTTAALTGCTTVGPDYKRPELAGVSGRWITPLPPGEVDQRWWQRLDDPQLNDLMDAALATNLDIRETQARLREARANRDAAVGRSLPEVRAMGSATEQRVSENGQLPVGNIPGFDPRYSLYDVGFDASWELDFWGANRRSVEAAGARAEQASARVDDVRLQVIAEVVRSYADLRTAQQREQLLRDTAVARAETARLYGLRFRAGESSRLEAEQAQQRADAAAAAVQEPRTATAAAIYRLGLLTGRAPEAWFPALSGSKPLPATPEIVAAGVRSELLQRRPDIRAAEAELAAATADIGVATADLYPRFSLLGSIGRQARTPGDLLESASTRFSIGPSFSWPIFSFGRVRAQIRAADASADAAMARYEKAVLGALASSESAANRYANALLTLRDRAAAVGRAQAVADLAELRFRRGEDDRIQALEARAALLAEQLQLEAVRAEVVGSFVALHKELGGGLTQSSGLGELPSSHRSGLTE